MTNAPITIVVSDSEPGGDLVAALARVLIDIAGRREAGEQVGVEEAA